MGNTSVKPHPRSRHKKQVHWKAADRPAPPGKPQLVAETEITPDVVTIRWDRPRYDGGSPITGYLVEHRRYGSPHWVRATPLLVPFNELSLSGLEPGWRYQFRISAENAVGLSAPGELSELLTVTLQRSAVTAPRFIDELKDTVALENEKVEFIANFLGQPAPKVCWFKDGFEIFSSRRIRIITENDRSVLTIHQSSLSDEGEIKCTATNRAGHASTRAQLTLEAPPSIRLPRQYEDGLLFELGEVMRLKVSIAGRPAPLVFWSHNNDLVKSDDKSEIETTDKYSSVRVEEVQRTDRGEYQIKAVNKLGEAVASFLVTVTDKPSPPGQARVVMTLGRSVTLSWGLPNDDGGCKIGNYIVEYFRLGWDVWLKAATCRQLTTTIGDLIEGSEYKFRIKAESPYGISEPSDESDVIFIADPKRGIFTPTARSRSQPREIFADEYKPVAAKRKPRSQSSTRVETPSSRPTTPSHFYEGGIPIRPARSKVKSPSITPEPSPLTKRRTVTADNINKSIFDRASMARDLAYGSPEIQVKKAGIDNIVPSYNSPYSSEKLNQLPSTAVKSTVNVIHHQNLDSSIASNGNRRASSPVVPSYLQKAPSPISISPTINTSRQRQKSPSPSPSSRPMSPTSEPKYYQTQMPSSPRPMSPSSSRPMSPTTSRPMSPTTSRPMSPTTSRPMSPTSSRPMSPNLESNPYKRRRSPSPRPVSPPPEVKAYQKHKSPSPTPVKNIYEEERPLSPKLPAYEMYQKEKASNPSALPLEIKNQQLRRVSSPHTFINDRKIRASSPVPQINRRSPSPIRFIERTRSKSPSPLRSSKSRSPSPNRQGKHEAFDSKFNECSFSKGIGDNDPLSNSSEFMLVLLPDKQRGRGSTSDIKFDFDENAIPPPLSLSAPELGAEPLIFEPLRISVSSTELLHEYAMARFYDALAAEEAELEERAQNSFDESNRRTSVDIPKIQINSKDDQIIVGLERKNSLRRRLSAGAVAPQQLLWAQRRHSLRNPDLSEIPENNLRKFPMMLDNKSIEEASEEEINLGGTLRKFPLSLDDKREIFGTRQRSESEEREEKEFEKVRAKMAAQKKERKGVGIVQEEDWDVIVDEEEREYEESLSESETESSEDERLSPEIPPLYVAQEEEIYHPGFMHRTVQNKQKSKSDEPFEILTKPNPLPDPNFKPKPILKRRDIDDIPEKPIRKSINTNNTQQRSLSIFPQTNTKAKEARYDLESSSRQRSFSLFPQNSPSAADREVPTMRKRGSSPTIPYRKLSAVAQISGMAAASIGMPQPQKPSAPQKKPDEEIKVVVEHYGDIVRSYGQKKRTAPRVYLNADDLKAAADRQSREDLREIARSIENLAKSDSPTEENTDEPEFIPNDTNRRRSFMVEASTALFRTVKDSVSAALSGGDQQDEDDTIPPDAEIIPSSQRRGSAQINKRRPSRSPNKLETAKSAKKAAPMKSNARGENWSNLRAPSPNPQGRKSSPSPMRRTSLLPPATTQVRRNSLTGITPGKPKTKETTTQTAGDDSGQDPKSNVLFAANQEELSAKAEIKVRTTVDYITDLAMFVVACWLYLFQNELLAIPVLLVMVYRQLKEEIRKKLPRWMFGTKKAKRK